MKRSLLMALILILLSFVPAYGGKADVISVNVTETGPNTYRFDVTVRHGDTGWDHYADRWEVLGPDGKIMATRVLLHPHVSEQPFTRSLTGIKIPPSISQVTVRAHDKVHGYGGAEVIVTLPAKQ